MIQSPIWLCQYQAKRWNSKKAIGGMEGIMTDLRRKLGDKISKCIDQQSFTIEDMDEIEDIIKEAGYVEVAEDQTLPKLMRGEDPHLYSFKEGQDSLVRVDWRRVVLEE